MTLSYFGGPLEIFNHAAAPDIRSLIPADRQRLVDRMADGTWAAATMAEKSAIYNRHRVLAKALEFAYQQSQVTSAGRLAAELAVEGRDERQAREAREAAENRRAQLRSMGYPGTMDEARIDKASLLALVSTSSLTAKMAFFKLPEYQQMTELAGNYAAHLEKLRSQKARELDDVQSQLDLIARRGQEINDLLNAKPPTDTDTTEA